MREFLRSGLVVVCLMLVLVQGASAFNVPHFVVDPSEAWLPGTPVVVSGRIEFTPSPGETFDSRHDLRFNTSLESAKWSWVPFEKGVETTRQPGIIPLPPPPFHYPKNENVFWKFTIEGIAPAVSETTNITIFMIQEVDEKGILIPGSSREYGEVVVYSEGPAEKANTLQSSLDTFRDHIDEKAADGINTILAEAKYLEARQKIENSTTRSSSYHNAQIEKIRTVDSAQSDITEGERLLDKAWAEKEVADAQVPINNVDMVIAWIKDNSSTADDSQLSAIIAKRDVAMSYIVSANEEISNGNYEQARAKADEAYQAANESFTQALRTRNVTCCDPDLFHYPFFRAGIAVIILILIGIVWWKKFPEE